MGTRRLYLVGGTAQVNAYGLTAAQSRELAAFLRLAAAVGPAGLLRLAAELERYANTG
jgi:hypothetical protein